MAFNHYAKLKRILDDQRANWYIRRIDKPTTAKNFKGTVVHYDHYYRLYDAAGNQIPYGKFQQIDKLARTLGIPVEELPVVE